jgi:hypothetical protein
VCEQEGKELSNIPARNFATHPETTKTRQATQAYLSSQRFARLQESLQPLVRISRMHSLTLDVSILDTPKVLTTLRVQVVLATYICARRREHNECSVYEHLGKSREGREVRDLILTSRSSTKISTFSIRFFGIRLYVLIKRIKHEKAPDLLARSSVTKQL